MKGYWKYVRFDDGVISFCKEVDIDADVLFFQSFFQKPVNIS